MPCSIDNKVFGFSVSTEIALYIKCDTKTFHAVEHKVFMVHWTWKMYLVNLSQISITKHFLRQKLEINKNNNP